ncbi:MAG: molybdopterin-dependent oxidoreductase [Chloroflexi bacterium]|nr:molybdopterin-dependent oxidoreductase [Chloroflexota bacterium]
MMGTREFVAIGKPVEQVSGPAKVTGGAAYTADVRLPGTLYGRILRSPYPHARILRIETARACALSGVHAVITAQDLPETLFGRRMRDMPVLARDKVRFVGERMAAVAAETPEIAEEAINRIEVEYEALPAVFDPLDAMKPDAPRVHESTAGYFNHQEPVPRLPNIYSFATQTKGDIAEGFRTSDRIFEQTFRTQSNHQGYLEPHVAIAHVAEDGHAHFWLSNKNPVMARNDLANVLDLPRERITAHVSHIGADFGGKGSVMDAPVAYHLAKASGRPVKLVMSYTEELTAANPRNPGVITVRVGVKADGRLWAYHVRSVWNTGAYQAFLPAGLVGGGLWAGGVYRISHVLLENIGVYSNCTPRGHNRGPGFLQAGFAVESMMDIVARELGIDPVHFRLQNLMESGEVSAIGHQMQDLHAKETLKAAAEAAGWGSPKPGPNIGRGVAIHDHHLGAGNASMTLAIDRDGTATVETAAPDTGTGNHTVFQQIVAEELKLPLDRVRIIVNDTDAGGEDSGVGNQRVSYVHGQAVWKAAQEARDALTETAADLLDAAPEQVSLDPSGFAAGARRASFGEVAALAGRGHGGERRWHVDFHGPERHGLAACSAQIAEVQVDPETGNVTLHKVVTAHDVGTILNPLYHQGQIDGGFVYGMGFAMMEELVIEDGRVANPHLGEYKMPTTQDVPKLITVLVPGATGPTPYEGKAIGELANIPPPGAIANAVFDAVGVRITETPISAEKVYRALQERAAR